jgi:hypothetical protein
MVGDIQVVRFCKVISTVDILDADRIKVRLSPEDNSKEIDEIDYAFPLLPKALHVKPKVGEAVLILLASTTDGNSQRYYIGPVISQDHRMYYDPFFKGADSFLRGAFKKFDPAPSMDPQTYGALPNDNDIVIRGRKNTDIQLTEDDIRIKAGVKVVSDSGMYKFEFNKKNPSYGKFKYHTKELKGGNRSTVSLVGDKIMLLSHNSPNHFELTDRIDLITDDEMNKIIESAYKLPYGEKLVEFLKTFVNAFAQHTHNFVNLPPNPAFTTQLISEKESLLDREMLLSDTVRMN